MNLVDLSNSVRALPARGGCCYDDVDDDNNNNNNKIVVYKG